MRNSNYLFKFVVTFLVLVVGSQGFTQSNSAANEAQVESQVAYLLSIDRLHYYIQNLADFLDGKVPVEIIQGLRSITPEDIYSKKIAEADINNPAQWQQLVHKLLIEKNPQLNVQVSQLEWNYNFFKNKLMERFKVKDTKKINQIVLVPDTDTETPNKRSIPKIHGKKFLLDVERYIAEKTSRAIIWDSILNDRDFVFHIGTQRDFLETLRQTKIKVLFEVHPMARNYNKIFMTYNEQTGRYAYVMNLISGDDRVKHLAAQLRLIRFQDKSYITKNRQKVFVYGNAHDLHAKVTDELLDIFSSLPPADKVIIGQKGAIEEAIQSAGMLDVVREQAPEVMQQLKLTDGKKSKFENLTKNATQISTFLVSQMKNSPVKIDAAYEQTNDSLVRVFQQFNSDQPSHEFADYLFLDKTGKIQRWRVFSAVWGDEIIPIAEALKRSGHTNVTYIGTAGALAGKGIKVGDVVPGTDVLTHEGKKLAFSSDNLVSPPENRSYTVGQVHTPYDETDTWLAKNEKDIDIVEVETGYLREHLGPDIKLESYFLISDIVGSEDATLAHAAQNASKRKRGQLQLLENLFVKNGIKAPIANYDLLPNDPRLKTTLNRLVELRPSRELFSLLQVAYVAVKSGDTTDENLEKLLKDQTSFDRKKMDNSLSTLGEFLSEIQERIPKESRVGIISEEIFNGSFNPSKVSTVKIFAEGYTAEQLKKRFKKSWSTYMDALSKYFKIEIIDDTSADTKSAHRLHCKSAEDFFEYYETEVLNKAGFVKEIDINGNYNIDKVPGLGKIRCESLFL